MQSKNLTPVFIIATAVSAIFFFFSAPKKDVATIAVTVIMILIGLGFLAGFRILEKFPGVKRLVNRFVLLSIGAILVLGVTRLISETLSGKSSALLTILLLLPLGILAGLYVFWFLWYAILFRMGAKDDAIKHLTLLLKLNPRYALAYQNRAAIYYQKGDIDLALKDYQRAIDIVKELPSHSTPPPISSHYDLGMIYNDRVAAYSGKGDYQMAVIESTRALSLPAISPNAQFALLYNRGFAYLEQGNAEQALADFTAIQLETLTSSIQKVWTPLLTAHQALALYAMKRVDEAVTMWQTTLSLEPRYSDRDWLKQNGKWSEAKIATAVELTTIIRGS